jgi:hypothetical protein
MISAILSYLRDRFCRQRKNTLRPDVIGLRVKRASFLPRVPPQPVDQTEEKYHDSYDGLPDPPWLGTSENWKRS